MSQVVLLVRAGLLIHLTLENDVPAGVAGQSAIRLHHEGNRFFEMEDGQLLIR
ncbi:MAG: hypothetical protein ACTSUE_23595 [Promethearchaeota archaeon]